MPTVVARGADIWPECLAVRVFDEAGVPEPVLRKAILTAQEIFKTAGIETEWLTCSASGEGETCHQRVAGHHLIVKIRLQPIESLRKSAAFATSLLFADSRTGDVAFLFYGRVKDAASGCSGFASQLLANLMAHEIAHLVGLGTAPEG